MIHDMLHHRQPSGSVELTSGFAGHTAKPSKFNAGNGWDGHFRGQYCHTLEPPIFAFGMESVHQKEGGVSSMDSCMAIL